MKNYLLFISVLTFFYSCQTPVSNNDTTNTNDFTREKPKTAEELRQELKEKEQVTPTLYLSAKATIEVNITQKPDFFHHTKTDGYLLKGTIINSSTIAKFKDAKIVLTFYSETQTAMESKEFILYKYFKPSSETIFENKLYPPDGFKSFSIDIKDATPVD